MRKYVPIKLSSFSPINTSRISLPAVWAETAETQYAPVDPDLDTAHFLFIENRYQSLGWQTGEIEPEQWQNFLQQITDLKINECLQYGFFNWFADVVYLTNSICFFNGDLYISLADNNVGHSPDEAGSKYWTLVFTISGSEYESTIPDLVNKVSTHIAATGSANPHQDDVTTIGGYTEEEIDEMFSPDNPETMAHHVADMNNPHEVTCEQLQILPKEGGIFTGIVKFSGGINIGNGFIGWI